MLRKLRVLLKREGTVTIDQLARELDTSPEMVYEMMEHLARAGQLEPMMPSCESVCQACVLVRYCERTVQGRVWQVKG